MWNDVELLLNEDSSTVRFGSASPEENGSNLYQVDTLVKVSSSEVKDRTGQGVLGLRRFGIHTTTTFPMRLLTYRRFRGKGLTRVSLSPPTMNLKYKY